MDPQGEAGLPACNQESNVPQNHYIPKPPPRHDLRRSFHMRPVRVLPVVHVEQSGQDANATAKNTESSDAASASTSKREEQHTEIKALLLREIDDGLHALLHAQGNDRRAACDLVQAMFDKILNAWESCVATNDAIPSSGNQAASVNVEARKEQPSILFELEPMTSHVAEDGFTKATQHRIHLARQRKRTHRPTHSRSFTCRRTVDQDSSIGGTAVAATSTSPELQPRRHKSDNVEMTKANHRSSIEQEMDDQEPLLFGAKPIRRSTRRERRRQRREERRGRRQRAKDVAKARRQARRQEKKRKADEKRRTRTDRKEEKKEKKTDVKQGGYENLEGVCDGCDCPFHQKEKVPSEEKGTLATSRSASQVESSSTTGGDMSVRDREAKLRMLLAAYPQAYV